jgi:hypothetical protein
MLLPMLNKRQIDLVLLVLVAAATLFMLAFAYHVVVFGGLEFNLGAIAGECTVASSTCVGA